MRILLAGTLGLAVTSAPALVAAQELKTPTRKPQGGMVKLGSHRLHVNCTGKGSPVVVIESGFDEFSSDWALVQRRVQRFARVCTYDRAGYAWSDAGPAPQTFDQINLELHDALAKLGEHGSFVLVGHLFGGPIMRNFATTYPHDVAGVVFVEAVSEDQRFQMWHKAVLMRDGATGKAVPPPHEQILHGDRLADSPYFNPAKTPSIEPPFDRLPPDLQGLHVWAQSQRSLAAAEENERTWSPEYFARWHDHPQADPLGRIPLIVLSCEQGNFHDLDMSGAQQEDERKANQRRLSALSVSGEQRIVASGQDMQVEAPDAVVQAIQDVCSRCTQECSRRRATVLVLTRFLGSTNQVRGDPVVGCMARSSLVQLSEIPPVSRKSSFCTAAS